jgi:superfamily II DNA or RNA helicase
VTGATPAAQAVATPGTTGGRIIPTAQPAYGTASLRAGLRTMPQLPEAGLWPAQVRAIRNLERSLAENRPRALIQMATGSGKTYTAVNAIYRMVKHAGARRVLFLVDRSNLGRQALREFQAFRTPDDQRHFTELYNVQHLTSNKVDPVARVCISTIQRLYSILQGDEELPEDRDEESLSGLASLIRAPVPVAYNAALPIEFFDVVFIDECHRSIYTLWKQVLDYFDAFLIGLTADPWSADVRDPGAAVARRCSGEGGGASAGHGRRRVTWSEDESDGQCGRARSRRSRRSCHPGQAGGLK